MQIILLHLEVESFVAMLSNHCGQFPVVLVFRICIDGSVFKQTVSSGLLFLSVHINLVSPLSLWIHPINQPLRSGRI